MSGESTRHRARKPRLTLRIAASVVLISALTVAAGAGSAHAEGGGDGCNPGRSDNYLSYYIAGTQQSESTVGAVSSSIYNYSPFVYSHPGNYTTSWDMLTDGSLEDWAQIGWYEVPGNTRGTLVQFAKGNTVIWTNFDQYVGDPINTNSTYETAYSPGGSGGYYFRFYLDLNQALRARLRG